MFSDFKEVRFRVPHGTILGPVLFIIHINNLRIQPTTGHILSFEDDTVICILLNCLLEGSQIKFRK